MPSFARALPAASGPRSLLYSIIISSHTPPSGLRITTFMGDTVHTAVLLISWHATSIISALYGLKCLADRHALYRCIPGSSMHSFTQPVNTLYAREHS
jgi:hypothetical protein